MCVLGDSPRMAERFDRSLSQMILQNRNHPCITIWGLLNETADGPVFRHAVASLPLVRALDDRRLVLLNSGGIAMGCRSSARCAIRAARNLGVSLG